jgi:hypothetical protein
MREKRSVGLLGLLLLLVGKIGVGSLTVFGIHSMYANPDGTGEQSSLEMRKLLCL